MKEGSLITSLLLFTLVAQAEKFDNIGEEVAALAKWLLLAVGGGIAAVIGLIFWLTVRQWRKMQQAREQDQTFYESLQRR